MNTVNVFLILSVCFTDLAQSFLFYRDYIPVDDVPLHCGEKEDTERTKSIGHLATMRLNRFGKDFQKHFRKLEYIWKDLCNKDSDGDGMSNGEELGDPKCEWTLCKNATECPRLIAKSHPGYREKRIIDGNNTTKGFRIVGYHKFLACKDTIRNLFSK